MNSGNTQTRGGALGTVFKWIVYKRLSPVETDIERSHQHEFNGSRALVSVFGKDQPQRIATDFIWMPDDGAVEAVPGLLTWYDARARHPTRSEYRLYFYDNSVTAKARPGDLLLIGRRLDGSTLLVLAPGSGTAAARIAWLFGIEVEPGAAFTALELQAADLALLASSLGGSDRVADEMGWEVEADSETGRHDENVLNSARFMQRLISRDIYSETSPVWPGTEMGNNPLDQAVRILAGAQHDQI